MLKKVLAERMAWQGLTLTISLFYVILLSRFWVFRYHTYENQGCYQFGLYIFAMFVLI